jgi:hypothetical protein
MRIVVHQNRSEFEPDPVRALQRAVTWNNRDNAGTLAHPRGVFRGSQDFFNALDAQRALQQARLLNAPHVVPSSQASASV